jgi:anti-sigma regulatory factor (Ser/Thr protein kinase)
MRSTANAKASLCIGNAIAEMSKVADFVESFGVTHRLPSAAVNDMNLCLDELLNNTITYGYADDVAHSIAVSLTVERGRLVAELADDARPFDPRRSRFRPRAGGRGRRRIGKLGLRFVNALMDNVDYLRSDDYNLVRLEKMLQPAAPAGAAAGEAGSGSATEPG